MKTTGGLCEITLKSTIQNAINSMSYDGDDLPNMMTNISMPDNVAKDICSRDEIGQGKHEEFIFSYSG